MLLSRFFHVIILFELTLSFDYHPEPISDLKLKLFPEGLEEDLAAIGGYTCYAFAIIVLANTVSDRHIGRTDIYHQTKIREACGKSKFTQVHPKSTVVLMHHNGFGNQLFQRIFGNSLSKDLGFQLTAVLEHSPHLYPGWQTLNKVFYREKADRPPARCLTESFSWDICPGMQYLEPNPMVAGNCTGNNVEFDLRPKTLKFKSVTSQAATLLRMLLESYKMSESVCIKLTGYFQEFPLFHADGAESQRIFDLHRLPKPDPPPLPNEIVVHLRWCHGAEIEKMMHMYYDRVLDDIMTRQGGGKVSVVTACGKGDILSWLIREKNATVHRGKIVLDGGRGGKKKMNRDVYGILADYAFMTHAKNLVTQFTSTFSFWAAAMALSHEGSLVHIQLPMNSDQPCPPVVTWPEKKWTNMVYHHIFTDNFWGRYDAWQEKIIYHGSVTEYLSRDSKYVDGYRVFPKGVDF